MTRSILVVDDERDLALTLSAVLDDAGYAARCAFDGLDGLRLMRQEPPDLLISDVRLPGMDGPSLARRLRRGRPGTPVILMSADYADVDLPGVRFVPKPFDLEDMLRLVRRALGDAPGASGSGRARPGTRPAQMARK